MSEDSAEPSAIVDQLHTLTEIEGGLAETALAVSAAAPAQDQAPAEPQSFDAPADPASVSAGDAQAGAEDKDVDQNVAEALLDDAKATERVLEDAIPDPPSVAVASASVSAPAPAPVAEEMLPVDQSVVAESSPFPPSSTQENVSQVPVETVAAGQDSSIQAPVPVDPITAATPTLTASPTSPSVAAQAQQAIQAVEADLNNSILPAKAAEPAHDVEMETANKEDTGKIQVQIEEPTVENVVKAVANGEGTQQPPASADPSTFTPIPEAAPVTVIEPSSVSAAAADFVGEPKAQHDSDIVFPAGLSANSSSILANPGLFAAWTRDPTPETTLRLFTWSVQKTEIADARAWYDILAESEPTAVQPLLALINLELALSNFEQVEALFGKALNGPSGGVTAAADVSVWKAYLHYIRRQNPIPDVNPDSVRSTITNAYDFALKECGTDRESGEIWQEYIAFIGEPKPTNTWDLQQQMDTLRRTYQRAVCIPLNNVEVLWKQYDAFESGLNKLTAKKFLAERSPAYMTARTALRELSQLTDSLPRPPLPPHPTFSDHDRRIVSAWKAYIKWEEGNPLVIEDQEALSSRIGYALRKCLGEMRHFPELWHYAANYYAAIGKVDVAADVLAAGVQACPSSVLLTFALADIEEDRRNVARVHEVYTALLDRLNPEIDRLQEKVAAEVEAAKGPEIQQNTGDVDMTGDGLSEIQRAIEQREARGKAVAERGGRDVADLAAAAGVVWVMYMRFARRAEGIKAARGIFGKARKSAHPTWHIFEASAMMEYHANKDSSVAIRIFELGFKLFADDVEYVVRYLQFLLSINDDTNARALFERSAAKIAPEKARPLWDTWARYEYMFGDLSAVHKLEARFAETFPKDSPLKRFAQRFTYNGLDLVALRDLGFGLRQNIPPPGPASGGPPSNVVPTLAPTQPLPIPAPTLPISQPLPTAPPIASPPAPKRAFPESPRAPGQGPAGPTTSPSYKRPRGQSPPRQFNRVPSGGGNQVPGGGGLQPPRNFRDRTSRDRDSPMNRGSVAPVGGPTGRVGTPDRDRDRSGVSRSLAWFIGTLPSARSFDGPVFRPDDIMGLFSNIARDGTGIKSPVPNASLQGYGAPPHRNGPAQGYTPPIQNRSSSGPPPTGAPARAPGALGGGYGYSGPPPSAMPPMGVPRNGGYGDRYGGPPRRY